MPICPSVLNCGCCWLNWVIFFVASSFLFFFQQHSKLQTLSKNLFSSMRPLPFLLNVVDLAQDVSDWKLASDLLLVISPHLFCEPCLWSQWLRANISYLLLVLLENEIIASYIEGKDSRLPYSTWTFTRIRHGNELSWLKKIPQKTLKV